MKKLFLYARARGLMASRWDFGFSNRFPTLLVFFLAMAVPALALADNHEFLNPSVEPDMLCHRIELPHEYCQFIKDSIDSGREIGELWMLFPCNGYVCGYPDDLWFPMPFDLY